MREETDLADLAKKVSELENEIWRNRAETRAIVVAFTLLFRSMETKDPKLRDNIMERLRDLPRVYRQDGSLEIARAVDRLLREL